MLVADYLAQYFHRMGVRHVFELAGGMTLPLLDAIHRLGKTRIVSMKHEQAAAFAAEATGRLTGVPGVELATSGPGATNLLTGIASAYYDSAPMVAITGQVPTTELSGHGRQQGFQELPIVAMAGPVTKGAWQAESPDHAIRLLHRAFALAVHGRPGPALVDLPLDLQQSDATIPSQPDAPDLHAPVLGALLDDLNRAKRPLILVGGGVRASGTGNAFLEFVNALGVPVVHSLMGVDALPYHHSLRVGMIGAYGNRWANMALARSDFILVLGSRLDVRQTGSDCSTLSAKTIYHVDIDPGEINSRVTCCHPIIGDLRAFFQVCQPEAESRSEWLAEINGWRAQWPDTQELDVSGINPHALMHELRRVDAATIVTDVGQNQMWAAQSLELQYGQRFLTSGGLGAMGFALPAAIGAALAIQSPHVLFDNVLMIAGDGGFQVNIQELETIANLELPVRMVILDNASLGMVRQTQDERFGGRHVGTSIGYSRPDFDHIAEAYNIPSLTISRTDEVSYAIAWLNRRSGPALLHVHINGLSNAYPKLTFGGRLDRMEPLHADRRYEHRAAG